MPLKSAMGAAAPAAKANATPGTRARPGDATLVGDTSLATPTVSLAWTRATVELFFVGVESIAKS